MTIPVARREFLQATGVLTGLLAVGSPLALLAPSRAWAVDLTSLTTAEATTLLAATRTIAPHDKLEDAAYAFVIRALDAAAAKDEALHKQLQEGVASLGAGFASDPEIVRVQALRRIESTAFFQDLRVRTLLVLYSTPLAYAISATKAKPFPRAVTWCGVSTTCVGCPRSPRETADRCWPSDPYRAD